MQQIYSVQIGPPKIRAIKPSIGEIRVLQIAMSKAAVTKICTQKFPSPRHKDIYRGGQRATDPCFESMLNRPDRAPGARGKRNRSW